MREKTLPAGTLLYHGTAAMAEFAVPRGPAWFAETAAEAARWCGWRKSGLPVAFGGPRRVLVVRLAAPVTLPDTAALRDWEALNRRTCGTSEPYIEQAVRGVVAAGLAGWYGRTEVMLVDTAGLEPVEAFRVRDPVRA